jgi:hypothetical protein
LPGLDRLVAEQRRASHWFWRLLDRGERLERHTKRLEHELGRISERLEHMSSYQREMAGHIQNMNHAIHGLLENRHEPMQVAVPDLPPVAAVHHAGLVTSAVEEVDLSGMPLPAKRIFVELRKAVVAARAGGEK